MSIDSRTLRLSLFVLTIAAPSIAGFAVNWNDVKAAFSPQEMVAPAAAACLANDHRYLRHRRPDRGRGNRRDRGTDRLRNAKRRL